MYSTPSSTGIPEAQEAQASAAPYPEAPLLAIPVAVPLPVDPEALLEVVPEAPEAIPEAVAGFAEGNNVNAIDPVQPHAAGAVLRSAPHDALPAVAVSRSEGIDSLLPEAHAVSLSEDA